jgi:hypothetical protein
MNTSRLHRLCRAASRWLRSAHVPDNRGDFNTVDFDIVDISSSGQHAD